MNMPYSTPIVKDLRYKSVPLLRDLKNKIKDILKKPHEYQILLPSIGVGITVQTILNKAGISIRDIPSDSISEGVIYAGFITTFLSIFKYSTGKIQDIPSKAKADSIVLGLSQNGDILRGACNMLYRNGLNQGNIKDTEATKKHQRELKYTYVAMTLLASYIIRGETGPCHDCFTEVCKNWGKKDASMYCKEDTEQMRHYKKIFRKAIKHITEVEGLDEGISGSNVSLIVEVINTLEDYYDEAFVDFSTEVGIPFSTPEEALAVSHLTVKTEVDTLDFWKEQVRNRKAFFWLLCSLSAASLGKTEGVEALEWINEYFIKDILDFLASHANAIVGTTVAYTSARALGTVNANNVVTKYISKRLTPDTRRVQPEDNH